MKEKKRFYRGNILFLILLLVLVLGATAAWFTFNRTTKTNVATAKTGEDSVELYISRYGGADFEEEKSVDITQVSKVDQNNLMPVSTADLSTYLYSTTTISGKATTFGQDSDGSYYYQGRVYLKAVNTGKAKGNGMDLYLNTSEGDLVVPGTGGQDLLRASRLGLSFNNGEKNVMFWLDNTEGSDEHTIYTYINGVQIGKNQVLTLQDGKVVAVDSPAIDPASMSVKITDEKVILPTDKLIKLKFNEIYQVDVFFYIEGCDPECSDDISTNDITMHLAFYGVLS